MGVRPPVGAESGCGAGGWCVACRARGAVIGDDPWRQDRGQAALVRALLADGLPTVVAALRLPYDLAAFPEAPTFVCAYSIVQPSLEALEAALWSAAPVEGRLPVSIPGLYPAAS